MDPKTEEVNTQNDQPKLQSRCRFCGTALRHTFVDLGKSPLCESFLAPEQLNQMEPFYPLHVYVCDRCFLVQLEEYVGPGHIFAEYAYFSSYSGALLENARSYTNSAVERFQLDGQSQVVEIASNDGYLLQYFVEKKIPALGIEPAANVAKVAIEQGLPTLIEFFGSGLARRLAAEGKQADLLIGNNVLAQVPALNDFVEGMKTLLKSQGVITMEFPHLMCLIEGNQFDTIYHEHFSYFSFTTAEQIFAAHRLTIFDLDEITTHGGSLRIYACHAEDSSKSTSERVTAMRMREKEAGLTSMAYYSSFAEQVKETKRKLLDLLIQAKREGKSIAGYGAPGKGNTLLNYCGIRTDFIDYTVDRNPYKHGKFLPGTHIPIYPPDKIKETQPDYVLILPWNLREEIMAQLSYIRDWGGQFLVPIPEARLYS
jgi:hypothetical protein